MTSSPIRAVPATAQRDRLIHLATATGAAYVIAIVLATSIPGLSRSVHLAVGLMLLALAAILWTRPTRLRPDVVPVGLGLFFLFAFASVTWSIAPSAALEDTIGLAISVVGALCLLVLLRNGASLPVIATAGLMAGAVQILVALTQYDGETVRRATGLATNPNAMAVRVALVGLIAMLAIHRRAWPKVLFCLLLVGATVFSGSRKIVFVWATFVMILAHRSLHHLGRSVLTSAVTLIVLPFLLLLAWSNAELLMRPVENLYVYQRVQATLSGEEGSAQLRESMASEAIRVWLEAPYFGFGTNQFRYASDRFGTYSHNNYTELLADFGIVGFLLYYLSVLALAARFVRTSFRAPLESIPPLIVIGMLLLWDVAIVSYSNRLVWVAWAVLIHLSYQATDSAALPEEGK